MGPTPRIDPRNLNQGQPFRGGLKALKGQFIIVPGTLVGSPFWATQDKHLIIL
jgi:hypothetical protein